jgi:hypothetical protein
VDAWSRLSDDQKDVYDMKEGLPATLSPDVATVFASVSSSDGAKLTSGFGNEVGACWDEYAGMQASHSLRIRGRGDLEKGLRLIRQEV